MTKAFTVRTDVQKTVYWIFIVSVVFTGYDADNNQWMNILYLAIALLAIVFIVIIN